MTRLVVAGTHAQFLAWVAQLEPSLASLTHRPIWDRRHLLAINVYDVESFDLVGTYGTNPVWGSDEYREFMADGLRLGMTWAREWPIDWHQARATGS